MAESEGMVSKRQVERGVELRNELIYEGPLRPTELHPGIGVELGALDGWEQPPKILSGHIRSRFLLELLEKKIPRITGNGT